MKILSAFHSIIHQKKKSIKLFREVGWGAGASKHGERKHKTQKKAFVWHRTLGKFC
jgi:hypothetical protein